MLGIVLIGLFVIFSYGIGNVSASSTSSGNTIYVNGSGGNDTNDGSSWLLAKQSISNATGTVNTNGTINIANGQYTGTGNTGITIDKNMNINGQSETGTIINGTDTSWIFSINSGIEVTISNLTLTNGTTSVDNSCGAILSNGTCTVNGCTFIGNTAITTDYLSGGGSSGAIFAQYGNLTVNGCTFIGNTANWGGAIFSNGTCTINDSNFTGNNATNGGGAIYAQIGTCTITGCTFTNNTVPTDIKGNSYGGAIASWFNNLTVTECTFTNNIATDWGGAILCDDVEGSDTLTVQFNRFYNNTSKNGTAIWCGYYSGNATFNWWGSNTDPTTIPNLIVVDNGSLNTTSWVILTVNANPITINNGGNSTITADLNHYMDSTGHIGTLVTHIPDGPITLDIPWGSLDSSGHSITEDTVNGAIIPVTFYANEGAVNPLYNPVKVTANVDGYTTNDTESAYITINKAANLVVTKTGPESVIAGNQITYTITVTNYSDPAENVVIQDVIPGILQNVVHDSFNLGTIGTGQTKTVTITGTVPSNTTLGTIINNNATVTSDTLGTITPSNTISTTVNTHANIDVTINGPTNTIAGTQITYTITVTNKGTSDAQNVVIQDVIPGILQNVVHDSFNLGTISAGQTKTVTITGTVPSNTVLGTVINNNATVTSDTLGTITPSNTISTTVGTHSDVGLTETVNKSRPNVGETVTFTVTAHNNGPSDATNIQISDLMPSNFANVTVTSTNGTYVGGVWTFNLTSGESTNLTLSGTVTSQMAGKNTTNTASIQGSTDIASASIYVPKSDLYIQITSNKNNPKVGESFTITYKLSNKGPDNATNVTVTIPLPSGFELSNISGNGNWTYNTATRTITWTISNVPVGDPYLYITGKTNASGLYVFDSSISSETYNLNSEGVEPITISTTNPVTPKNSTTILNADTNTIPMQHTGIPIAGLLFGILSIIGGSVMSRKR